MRPWYFDYDSFIKGTKAEVEIFRWIVPNDYVLRIQHVSAAAAQDTRSPFEYLIKVNRSSTVHSTCDGVVQDALLFSDSAPLEIAENSHVTITVYQLEEGRRSIHIKGVLVGKTETHTLGGGGRFIDGAIAYSLTVPPEQVFKLYSIKARSCIATPATIEYQLLRRCQENPAKRDVVAGYAELEHPSNKKINVPDGLAQRLRFTAPGKLANLALYLTSLKDGTVKLYKDDIKNEPIWQTTLNCTSTKPHWENINVPQIAVAVGIYHIVLEASSIDTIALRTSAEEISGGRLFRKTQLGWKTYDENGILFSCIPLKASIVGYDYTTEFTIINKHNQASPSLVFDPPRIYTAGTILTLVAHGKGTTPWERCSHWFSQYCYGVFEEKPLHLLGNT